MLKSNILSLDLELNQPSNTIIQLGIAVGNLNTGEILLKEVIDIHTTEILNPFIIDLTGIRQIDVDHGQPLQSAYERMVSIANQYDTFINPITWGGGDTETLRKQLDLDHDRWRFGRRWIDVKTVYIAWRTAQQKEVQGGLAKAMTKLGLCFSGRKHNAGDDAANTFRIYHRLLQEFSVFSSQNKGTS
jgi:inhibitor of KinA sporulation pathway (predicted exonuclease)